MPYAHFPESCCCCCCCFNPKWVLNFANKNGNRKKESKASSLTSSDGPPSPFHSRQHSFPGPLQHFRGYSMGPDWDSMVPILASGLTEAAEWRRVSPRMARPREATMARPALLQSCWYWGIHPQGVGLHEQPRKPNLHFLPIIVGCPWE